MPGYPKKTFTLSLHSNMYKALKVNPYGDKRGIVELGLSALLGRECVIDFLASEEMPLSIRGYGAFELDDEIAALNTNSKIYGGFPPDTPEIKHLSFYLPMDVDNWYVTDGKLKLKPNEYKNIYSLYYPEKIPGKYIKNWFSNFNEMSVPIVTSDGLEFHTVENYYQAMKSRDFDFRKKVANATASAAKKLAKAEAMGDLRREDWHDINNQVMYKALHHKYTKCSEHNEALLDTDRPIVEFNNWNDKFWGVSIFDFTGENRLGRMLMNIRLNLRGEVPF